MGDFAAKNVNHFVNHRMRFRASYSNSAQQF
nr:MAG TPA: hypothetical protein [Caudoviricetes sp.]